jgi:S-DNA-T family DNA segregation ATPase FtsK/SpoIIIE
METNKEMLMLSSLLESEQFKNTEYQLPIALGKTVVGDMFMLDLYKVPHLLVAGVTGSGKTVSLNTIVASLLYKKQPSELKFVLINPKRTDFGVYNSISKQFLAKLDAEEAVVTDLNKAVLILKSVCKEMEERLQLLRTAKVRNIKEYNEAYDSGNLKEEKCHRKLPYIVVVIDEFADLILSAGKDFEYSIAQLAQLSRAVGIYLIIATQHISNDVVTGNIMANFPARLIFRVEEDDESHYLLGFPEAIQLKGKGDAFYSYGKDLSRVQCAFISAPEIEEICKSIADQQTSEGEYILPKAEEKSAESNLEISQRDPLLEAAARLVVQNKRGSVSMIQRKLSIGYKRAGDIMKQLEAAGIVGPYVEFSGWELLVNKKQLEKILEDL